MFRHDTARAAASQQAAKRVTVGMSAKFDHETNSFPARFGGTQLFHRANFG
jgi:hypothetical protein